MNLLKITPSWLKRLVRPLVPNSMVQRLHAPVSDADYIPWMVNRENPLIFKFKRNVLHAKPHLHRLVVHLTDHCNLNCRGCTHFSNIAEPNFADVDEFKKEFEQLTHIFLGMTEIFLLGGEPLLHPDVTQFFSIARNAFPKARINLMSNGVLVPRMDTEFWQALHDNNIWLVCDLYPINLKIDQINELCELHKVKLEWTDPRAEFFKLPIDTTGSQDPHHTFRECEGVNNCVLLRDGRLYPCAYVAYIDIFKDHFGVDGLEVSDEDSISIFENHSPYEIFDFLCKPVPWCKYCDIDHKTVSQWARSEKTMSEWTRES